MEAQTEKKISTLYLTEGMYVSSLDRPWLDTPFLMQGFLIKDPDEIMLLKKYCEYVYIDTSKGEDAAQYIQEARKLKSNDRLEKCLVDNTKLVEYVDIKTTTEEMPVARMAVDEASNRVVSLMESVKAGKSVDVKQVKGVVEPILESIIRNPEALMWLTQMRHKDSYTYSHSVDNCALAIAFGRHMGLPKDDLNTLAMGLLVMDIGKMKVPAEVLNKTEPLTEAEFKLVREHVNHSVEILGKSEGIDIDIVNIALTHHERFDGSGYPNGLVGVQTPVYGRIAGIIDCYDAMTSKRPYGDPVSPYTALQEIYNWRNKYFQEELVEQFLQCLGVFPTGSLVEMHSGEVAIVMAQNKTRRMSPQVMLLLDKDKKPYEEYQMIDLINQPSTYDDNPLTIYRGLDPGAYGLDPTEFYL
ncbi:MAG: HD-GYP domain-containing protein [Gammaproteobacteria bacterium]|nr:HD-GYP domain-containing protein [Gammaproteobacteria bacterium]